MSTDPESSVATILGEKESGSTAHPNRTPVGQESRSYSAFSKWQRRWIVFIAAFAAWFSTLTSFVYFPAITSLSLGLDTSIQNINLTVTSYLVIAGVAPAITASLSDSAGRRLTLLLSFAVFLVANIGLALQDSFAALLALRMLQAAGIAGSFAITYGILADITIPSERGSYIGVVAFW
jgi:MFS family permease